MGNVKFYRGTTSAYTKDDMVDGLFFTSDKNMILMNGDEFGSFPKDFCFVSEGSSIEKETICSDYNPSGQRFSFSVTVDLTNSEYLEVNMDLSVSTNENGITAFSIGNDISGWNNETLWFFYKKGGYSDGNNFMIQFGSRTYGITVDTSQNTIITIKNDGVYINDDKKVGAEYGITYLKTLSAWNVGSYRSDSDGLQVLSDATYNRISVYKQVGADSLTMSYELNKNEKRTIELPLVTTTSNGVMSYKDKQILTQLSSNVDGGIY